MNNKGMAISWLLALLVVGCSGQSTDPQKPKMILASDISSPTTWGSVENVVAVKHLVFSAQPDGTALNEGRDAGVEVVINLRGADEQTSDGQDWDESTAADAAGLTYYQVPVMTQKGGLDTESLHLVSELVAQHHEQRIWLHCASGNRAAAWFAVHLTQAHQMPAQTAIERARQVGLTKPALEDHVRQLLLEAQ